MKPSLKNMLLTSGSALLLAGGLVTLGVRPAVAADIGINIGVEAGPPPPPREVITASPGPGYVWVGGYWDGSPGHYRWVRGRWGRPPHGHTRWVSPRWERGHDGHYHRVEGGWR